MVPQQSLSYMDFEKLAKIIKLVAVTIFFILFFKIFY